MGMRAPDWEDPFVAGGVLWYAQTPGTYGYTCPEHPSFTGVITVAPAP